MANRSSAHRLLRFRVPWTLVRASPPGVRNAMQCVCVQVACVTHAWVAYLAGMFSGMFARPAWQNKAVHSYLDNTANLPTSNFNSSGRGCA